MKTALLAAAAVLAGTAALGAPDGASGIVYSEPGGESLTLDFHAPAGKAPHPAVILIHGGGFRAGSSRDEAILYCARFLTAAGYAVFAINYRLAPLHPYPAAVEDVQRAVRFVRHNARRWKLDPRRIAVAGASAGGYLANMAGVLPGTPRKSPDAVERTSAAVQAVVTLYGPSDFRGQPVSANRAAFLGRHMEELGASHALADASPAMHIRYGAPPFLFVHGDADESVPLTQSAHFQLALQEAGIRAELIVIRGGGHGLRHWRSLPGVRPWESETVEWLNRTLGHRGPIGIGIPATAGAAP
jgi:acetyl esterase/lipase